MARRSAAEDLEVIDLETDGQVSADGVAVIGTDGSQPRPWPGPWILVVGVTAVILALAVGPIRSAWNDRALDRLEHVLVMSDAVEDAAVDLVDDLLSTRPAVGDDAFLDALRKVVRAQQQQLRDLRGELPPDLFLEDRLRTARSALRSYLTLRVTELDALAKSGPTASRSLAVSHKLSVHHLRADRALADERERRGGSRDKARARDVELPSLESERARLGQPSEEPVGLTHVSLGPSGPVLLDLDTGRSNRRSVGEEGRVVVSGDAVAWVEEMKWFDPAGRLLRDETLLDSDHDYRPGFEVVVAPLAATEEPAARLDRVVHFLESATPGTFWLAELDAKGAITAREIDGAARTLQGPFLLPAGYDLFGATPAGLVLTPTFDGLDDSGRRTTTTPALWDPVKGTTAPVADAKDGLAAGVGGHHLLWFRFRANRMEFTLTDLRTGTHRPLPTPGSREVPAFAGVSPDARFVAVPGGIGWEIHDLADGTLHRVLGEPSGMPVWSSDGRHLFLPTTVRAYARGATVGTSQNLVRWDAEDRRAHHLRLRDHTWTSWGFEIVATDALNPSAGVVDPE